MKELLIEIGVEELPAIPFLKELPNIKQKWLKILKDASLESYECEFFYTPRRLVFFHQDFPLNQKDTKQQIVGAPKHIAFKDGNFTQAAMSFAKKNNISIDELNFKEIDGKEVLYFEKFIKGQRSSEILGDLITKFISSLNFGKSMRWGEGKYEFIRPIRSLACMLDGNLIEFEAYGIKSELSFYPHRKFGYDKIGFKNSKEYFEKLSNHGVILDQNERKTLIMAQIQKIASTSGLKIDKDEELLSEIVAITEMPQALLGKFDEEFLSVPSEAIITSMKENQRYFPTFKDGNLSNHFVVISNMPTDNPDIIVAGNEKVLKARLSDAKFFYEQDLAVGLNPEKLKNVTYLKELGSLYQKQEREQKIAITLGNLYKNKLIEQVGQNWQDTLSRAILLSKADLQTQMVYEFTELQGIMGSYYAKAAGENKQIILAIREQYLPDGENSDLPSTLFSSIVALSYKLDSLLSLFSIGKIPSGTKDPYALRRAANGVIKIILELKIDFDLKEILKLLSKNYAVFDLNLLENFILERLYTFFDANASIVKAVLSIKERNICKLADNITALKNISTKSGFKENFDTFKRLSNIIKDKIITDVNQSLLSLDAEINLNKAFNKIDKQANTQIKLQELFSLKPQIDKFFEEVMINVNDEKIKNNRLGIIGQIYAEFLKIADIKEISL